NYMDRQEEDDILGMLGSSEPDIFEDVKERLYTFEELTGLDSKEMRLLIARVDDDSLLATALRGAQEDVRRHFFNSMSQNRAADILEEMDHRGPLTVREINDARTFVLNIARRLDEEGTILIKKEKEEYI
ncbi:MAG: flagellar motor switch protein FliG, partial [Leptospiraceae bacterium]|nr:flagellar motor switch protein FliG [Leptospiraceae bacterium]